MMKPFEKEISEYITSIGGNAEDFEQILGEIRENGYKTMEQVIEHIENYY